MKTHIYLVHNGQKDKKCDICRKMFSRSVDLKRHINKIHNRQQDHKCESCGKSFSQAGNLKTHMKKHTKRVINENHEANHSIVQII